MTRGQKKSGNRTGSEYGEMVPGVGPQARPELLDVGPRELWAELQRDAQDAPHAFGGDPLFEPGKLEGAARQDPAVGARHQVASLVDQHRVQEGWIGLELNHLP